MILIDCRLVVVCIRRYTVLHFEEIIGIAINVRFWGCGQSDHDRIEVFENRAVFFEYAAVALVDDDEVKVGGGKHALPIFRLHIVYGVQHCRVCREYDPCAPVVLIGAQIAQRHIRQIVLEIVLCLFHQRRAISQEQNIGDVFAATEHIGEAGRSSGFACSCCHDQQVLSKALSDLLAYCTDGFLLVVTIRDPVIDRNSHQILPLGTTVHQLLQIVFAEYAADFALRAALIVPEVGFKTIGREHHGATSEFSLQTVSVQHSLFAAYVRVFAGSLGLHHCKW